MTNAVHALLQHHVKWDAWCWQMLCYNVSRNTAISVLYTAIFYETTILRSNIASRTHTRWFFSQSVILYTKITHIQPISWPQQIMQWFLNTAVGVLPLLQTVDIDNERLCNTSAHANHSILRQLSSVQTSLAFYTVLLYGRVTELSRPFVCPFVRLSVHPTFKSEKDRI